MLHASLVHGGIGSLVSQGSYTPHPPRSLSLLPLIHSPFPEAQLLLHGSSIGSWSPTQKKPLASLTKQDVWLLQCVCSVAALFAA